MKNENVYSQCAASHLAFEAEQYLAMEENLAAVGKLEHVALSVSERRLIVVSDVGQDYRISSASEIFNLILSVVDYLNSYP